jgi:hypothetical protein
MNIVTNLHPQICTAVLCSQLLSQFSNAIIFLRLLNDLIAPSSWGDFYLQPAYIHLIPLPPAPSLYLTFSHLP